MIPMGMSRGPQGRANVPVWLVAVGGVLGVIVLFLLFVLFTMGSAPTVSEVSGELPVQVQ